MKRIGLTILKFLAVMFGIAVFGVGNAQEAGDINFITFVALSALFGALAGLCGVTVWRYDDEEE